MTIRKDLQAKNGHRVVIIVAEGDEAIVARDHAEVHVETAEPRRMVRGQRRALIAEDANAGR
jgi:hypothetical protein